MPGDAHIPSDASTSIIFRYNGGSAHSIMFMVYASEKCFVSPFFIESNLLLYWLACFLVKVIKRIVFS